MAFQKNWNNEIIAQFYATLFAEDRGDTRKFHWMTEGMWYEITFEQFVRLLTLGGMMPTASRFTLHFTFKQAK
jgi:hypothetical protein